MIPLTVPEKNYNTELIHPKARNQYPFNLLVGYELIYYLKTFLIGHTILVRFY